MYLDVSFKRERESYTNAVSTLYCFPYILYSRGIRLTHLHNTHKQTLIHPYTHTRSTRTALRGSSEYNVFMYLSVSLKRERELHRELLLIFVPPPYFVFSWNTSFPHLHNPLKPTLIHSHHYTYTQNTDRIKMIL